jgi:hypothetical protein
MKRPYGFGQIYEKWGAYYGRWRAPGSSDGLTRAQADDAAEVLRARLAMEGARRSYLQNCESMQRVHISPALGKRRLDSVRRADVERLVRSLLARVRAVWKIRSFTGVGWSAS